MSDPAALLAQLGTVPHIERSISVACFILLVLWLVVRFLLHLAHMIGYHREPTTTKPVTQVTGVPIGADHEGVAVAGTTGVSTITTTTTTYALTEKELRRADMIRRLQQMSEVARTGFFLLVVTFLMMCVGDLATFGLVRATSIQVIAWVFTGLIILWVILAAVLIHPILWVVMGLIEYALVFAMWGIIFNRARNSNSLITV